MRKSLAFVALASCAVLVACATVTPPMAAEPTTSVTRSSLRRVYPRGSITLLKKVRELVAEMAFDAAYRDVREGVLVTSLDPVNGKYHPGLHDACRSWGPQPAKLRLHIFVPQDQRPGVVHVDAECEFVAAAAARATPAQGAMEGANASAAVVGAQADSTLAAWFLDRLEAKLAVKGRAWPQRDDDWPALRREFLGDAAARDRCIDATTTLPPSPEGGAPTIEPPRRVYQDQTFFTRLPRGASGKRAWLTLTVDPVGGVTNPRVIRGVEGRDDLADVARRAVSLWRYRPARLNGCPVATEWSVEFVF